MGRRHYAKKEPAPAAAAAPGTPAEAPIVAKPFVWEPPKLEDFREKPSDYDPVEIEKMLKDFPEPKEWKPVTNWSEFKFDRKILRIAEAVLGLNQLEMHELAKCMQLRLGLPDHVVEGGGMMMMPPGAMPMVGAVPGAAAAPGGADPAKPPEPEKKEQTTFNVSLVKVTADAKFKVLKEVRTLKPGMTIMESKDLVEKLPSLLKENLPKAEAEELVKKFKELGAELELK